MGHAVNTGRPASLGSLLTTSLEIIAVGSIIATRSQHVSLSLRSKLDDASLINGLDQLVVLEELTVAVGVETKNTTAFRSYPKTPTDFLHLLCSPGFD